MEAIHKRALWRFFAIFCPLLTVIAWPVSFIGRGYRLLVCYLGNALVVSSSGDGRYVGRLVANPRSGFEWHLDAIVFEVTTRSTAAQFDIDLHQTFYLPTAVFLALAVAGRCSWGARGFAMKLWVGVAILQLRGALQFVALERTMVDVAHANLRDVILVIVNRSLVTPLGMAFAMPLLLWVVLFARNNLRRPFKGV